jgi:predicted RNase H-like HicB family nuclease
MKEQLTAVFQKVPEGYIAFVEELPGANSQGDTLEEARSNLREAVQLVLGQPVDCKRSVGRDVGHSRATCADFMKRIDLIRHMERHGAQLLREGGNHTVYVNRKSG